MSINIDIVLIGAVALIYIDILIFCTIAVGRLKFDRKSLVIQENMDLLYKSLSGKLTEAKHKLPAISYFLVMQVAKLGIGSKKIVEGQVDLGKVEKNHLKGIDSFFARQRIESSVYLGMIGNRRARIAIEKKILAEKNYSVKLYMANALADIGNKNSIPVLVDSLINSHRFYREKTNALICDFGDAFNEYIDQLRDSSKIEIKELIVEFATVYYSEETKAYLIELVDLRDIELDRLARQFGEESNSCCANCIHGTNCLDTEYEKRQCKYNGQVNRDFKCKRHRRLPVSYNNAGNYKKLVYRAAQILAEYYPRTLDAEKYFDKNDTELRNIAISSLAGFNSISALKKLVNFVEDQEASRSAMNAISLMIERNPNNIDVIIGAFESETRYEVKQRLAVILAGRIEYFLMKLRTEKAELVKALIKEILIIGKASEIIDFLNKNMDIDLENELLQIVKEAIEASEQTRFDCQRYLDLRLLKKLNLEKTDELQMQSKPLKDSSLTRTLYFLLVMMIMFFPILYFINRFTLVFKIPTLEQIKIFVVDFNYYLAFYSLAISAVYLILLIFSRFNVMKQVKLWNAKKPLMLFKRRMLPGISIIAPAFNEEVNIIESANSLLNLKYPDYELIIVNDGSKDKTLDKLIKYYDLVRIDYLFDYKLNTKPVKGIYVNRSMPKLIVVDKVNGGKADSLNAGINISTKEYFCGIDADSIIEDDALLKLASLVLDESVETPALGGNVFPINGCKVERGQIKQIGLPKNRLARLQMIEYIRAFMAGRLGWAFLDSLLIISGAFGLFRKERVINVGGYLTSSGRFAKDTVGEDMELVVRITRFMKEQGLKFKICYAFNANCWTEVPEDVRSLKRQRYRWHRGLIDILTYHKKMIFNPKYGKAGMLAMPYFFIFEMIGPIFEIQGYFMVVVAFVLGLLNPEILLLLFVSTILMGVLISSYSLLIAEKDMKYFRGRDIAMLILYSILENFGPRQYFSFWRVGGYINMLKKPSEWGKQNRKGFGSKLN